MSCWNNGTYRSVPMWTSIKVLASPFWSGRKPGQVCEQQKTRTMHMVVFALEEKERCNKYRHRDSPWSFMLKPDIFSLAEVLYATSG